MKEVYVYCEIRGYCHKQGNMLCRKGKRCVVGGIVVNRVICCVRGVYML